MHHIQSLVANASRKKQKYQEKQKKVLAEKGAMLNVRTKALLQH